MTGAWFARTLSVNLLISLTIHGLRPMVSYRALSLGAGPVEIGLLGAAFAVLSLGIAVPVGRWVDRLGEPRLMLAGAAMTGAVAVALSVSSSIEALAVATAFLGVGQILVAVSVQTLIANAGAPGGRDGRFGVQTVVVSLAQLIGPAATAALVAASMADAGRRDAALPPVGATDGVFLLGAVAAGVALVVAATLWRWPPREHVRSMEGVIETRSHGSTRTALARVARTPSVPQAIAAGMTVLATIDILVLYLPAFGVATGIGVETVGLLLAVRAGASMTSRLLMLPLLRLLGRRRLLVVSMSISAVALMVVPLVGASETTLFVAMAFVGFGLGLGQPLTLSWLAGRVPADIRGTAIGMRLSANRMGQVAVPLAASLVAGVGGLAAIFWTVAVLLAGSAALVAATDFGDAARDETSARHPTAG